MPDRVPEPVEAKRYLSRKKVVETEAWDELMHGEHAHAFTVAHSQGAAVLDDIFGLLNDAMDNGDGYEAFKGKMRRLMENAGWYGRQDKGPDDEKYINWRTRLIYHTNMRTAFEAGRYRAQLRGAALRPIWEYKSKLAGTNRRQNHLALHGKAFRYDDSFWDDNRPPNGWNCECSIVSLSRAGAEREGVEVLSSGPDGTPPALTSPDGSAVDWNEFTAPEWRYNPGREALAPNFRRYKHLASRTMSDGRTALRHVVDRYRDDMDRTRLSLGEFQALVSRMSEKDYVPQNILYQVGNLDAGRHEAIMRAGVDDSKIMASDKSLYHETADKTESQKIPASQLEELYHHLQRPDRVYENTAPDFPRAGREIHFVKDNGDGRNLVAILRQKNTGTSLALVTMGLVAEPYVDGKFEGVWPE